MGKKAFHSIFTAISLCLIVFLAVSPSFAQDAGRGFTVIPPRFELFANPGENLTEKVRIRNESTFPTTYSVIVEDFATAGEEGQVVLEEDSADSQFNLARWITLSHNSVTLEPGEENTSSFDIAVPRDAEPGGHYASILFSSGTEAAPGAAVVSQRIGTLVLLRISGNVTEDASIETFETPTYSQTGPVDFTLRLKNNGNVHIQPKGTIVITNFLGQKVEELPLNSANVLPNATRKMNTVWDKQNILGTFTATLVATYGQQNLPLTAASRFTVISTTAAVLLAIGLVALVLFLISLFTGRRRLARALRILASGK